MGLSWGPSRWDGPSFTHLSWDDTPVRDAALPPAPVVTFTSQGTWSLNIRRPSCPALVFAIHCVTWAASHGGIQVLRGSRRLISLSFSPNFYCSGSGRLIVCGSQIILGLFFFFKRERERERERACPSRVGAERERETQNLKQASGSELSVQSPTWGSNL